LISTWRSSEKYKHNSTKKSLFFSLLNVTFFALNMMPLTAFA